MLSKEIICTLGPSTMNQRMIRRLEALGVSLFRINLSHTRLDKVAEAISFIQANTAVPICLDTEGAQVRTGELKNGSIQLPENTFVLVRNSPVVGDAGGFCFYPDTIVDDLEIGDFISIDFNSVLTQVVEKRPQGVLLRVINGGIMGQNKAVTVDRDIQMPPLTGKDKAALSLGYRMGIRCVALSFANKGSDVDAVRRATGKKVRVISKIETVMAVSRLAEIAGKSDALLIDRGDLSRQVSIERIPAVQKYIIRCAKKLGTPIYVATNLLESMITSPVPTRAEANDVYNTLSDGADGLVLAAETAIGAYPLNAAAMVSKIINQFSRTSRSYSIEDLRKKDYFLLPEPHGGELVNRVMENAGRQPSLKKLKRLPVEHTVLLDAEQIALGTFSPIEGFMNRKELESVVRDYRLPEGTVWPLPIVLQTSKDRVAGLKKGQRICLADEHSGEVYATMLIEDIYTKDTIPLSRAIFGTDSPEHPGVRSFLQRGSWFLGGPVELLKRLPSAHKYFELTPHEARTVFESKGWSRVLGFHTRNVIHRAHEHIQMDALEKYHLDGLFVHPVVGPKKYGDYSADIILKSYELMIEHYYPKAKIVLGAFQSYSRYCGPREAVFTALCRKNFGCSHFIVGRDHTGVGNFYGPDAAVKLFERLGDIGIVPVFYNAMHYCRACAAYVDRCPHDGKEIATISGSEGRQMIMANEHPPEWFMRRAISDMIISELKNGKRVFL